MKVIKLELHDLPDSFERPYYEGAVFPKISPKVLNELDTISYEESPIVTKELYPLQTLALGKYLERFYIREKDKEAFETLVEGFVDKAREDLLNKLIEVGIRKPKDLLKVIKMIKDGLELF